jgi:hypothetical protein
MVIVSPRVVPAVKAKVFSLNIRWADNILMPVKAEITKINRGMSAFILVLNNDFEDKSTLYPLLGFF